MNSQFLPGRIVELSPGVRVELCLQEKQFRGVGRVEIDGVALRGSSRPMFIELRTPDGVEFFDYTLESESRTAEGMILEFSIKARASGLQDWMVHTVRNLRVTRDWAKPEWVPAATRLRLHLRGIEEIFSGRICKGFEYFYEYESAEYPIYRLLDRSSWAVGGSILGNTFWLRNCFAPSLRHFSGLEDRYASEWYLGSISNPNIFQFQPFQTNLESFTMMTSKQGQLMTLAPRLAHLRSYFEKPRGGDEILHWHEHCGDLSPQFTTTPIQVLFCKTPATPVELINLNQAVRDHVSDGLHRQAGLRRERITTYGVIEEWRKPDLDDYTDRILPRMLETGIRCVFLPNQFQNNTNTWNVSNMCNTVDYKMSDPKEEGKLRRFCARARDAGVTVQMWGNTALSTLDFLLRRQFETAGGRIDYLPEKDSIFEMLDQIKDPYVRNPSGAIEADHYTPAFMVLNLRNPDVRAYWHRCWKEAYDSIGLRGLFLDSSFNLTSDKFHFIYNSPGTDKSATADQTDLLGQLRPVEAPPKSILSMYFAHLRLIAEMQGYGYHYSSEDIGVFGLNRTGPGVEQRLDNLFLWGDSYLEFHRQSILDAGLDPDEIFFKGLAYRLMWSLIWNFDRQTVSFRTYGGGPEDDPTPWHLDLLRAFNEVESLMFNRTILEEEKGVVYEYEDHQVFWAFASFDFELPSGATAREILTNKVFDGPRLRVEKHRVYCVQLNAP